MDHGTGNITTVTSRGVQSKHDNSHSSLNIQHEEADTLLIYFAREAHISGYSVVIYTQDTDVLVLALHNLPAIGEKASIIMGRGDSRRIIHLLPLYRSPRENRVESLLWFHSLSGCDITGRIFGKSKTTWWNTFKRCSDSILTALGDLGRNAEPSIAVLDLCEEFVCEVLRPKNCDITKASHLRWLHFCGLGKDQGLDKLPPTQGALHEHIRRTH